MYCNLVASFTLRYSKGPVLHGRTFKIKVQYMNNEIYSGCSSELLYLANYSQ